MLSSLSLNLSESSSSDEDSPTPDTNELSVRSMYSKETQTLLTLPPKQHFAVSLVEMSVAQEYPQSHSQLEQLETCHLQSPPQSPSPSLPSHTPQGTPKDLRRITLFQDSPGFSPIPHISNRLRERERENEENGQSQVSSLSLAMKDGSRKHTHVHWAPEIEAENKTCTIRESKNVEEREKETLRDMERERKRDVEDFSLRSISLLHDTDIDTDIDIDTVSNTLDMDMDQDPSLSELRLSILSHTLEERERERETERKGHSHTHRPSSPSDSHPSRHSSSPPQSLSGPPGATLPSAWSEPRRRYSLKYETRSHSVSAPSRPGRGVLSHSRDSVFWRDRLQRRFMTSILGSPKADRFI